MDPMVTMHIGLAGAPALKLPEFMKHPKVVPDGRHRRRGHAIRHLRQHRLINLGTNSWTIPHGHRDGLSVGREKRTALEMSNNLYFFTKNNDVRAH